MVNAETDPLINLIYDAAFEPKLWRNFTDALCQRLNSRNCNFHNVDLTNKRFEFIHNTIDKSLVAWYLEKFHVENPFYPIVLPLAHSGVVLFSHELLSAEEFEASTFYKYMKVIKLYHAMHLTVIRENNLLSGLALARRKEDGTYTEVEAQTLRSLHPHLQRAFRVGKLLARLEVEREILSQILNHLPQGAAMVSTTSHVIYSNAKAQKIFNRRDGLFLDQDGRLCAAKEDKELQRLISLTGKNNPNFSDHRGGVLKIDRPGELRPYFLRVKPLKIEVAHLNFRQPTALLLLNDPEQLLESDEEILQWMFELTPTEAHFAAILLRGKSPDEVAEELNITSNTAKTHLKHIFQKTETSNQRDLVILLLNSLAVK
ncbi:MAG TPA: LuxR C-terminal-related transcriptional regulator [Blastocatellia bacterium]|nr:LuxR C-terminal-related transcriptional regulator [Blastocatellia bacterium]HMZ17135.1 LuxR C-terminal-related transcriptional regulator [Blastocatellia bacterium]HNG32615.1 LuxR C-terminal-related transcriptional regulator [Blastocatellia bacterium]